MDFRYLGLCEVLIHLDLMAVGSQTILIAKYIESNIHCSPE